MQIGFVGLGKMGGNMVHRIKRDSDHDVVAYDFSEEAVKKAEEHGAVGASSLEDLVSRLDAPRAVWVMVPAGDPTTETVLKLGELLEEGDLVVDGGNSKWHEDKGRADELLAKGVNYVDVGYCMMVGGDRAGVLSLSPILDVLAPPDGWHHFGQPGAGHFVKMVHNGVEYGMMQAYAEGFELMHKSEFPIQLEDVAALWNRGSVVRSWLCELAEAAFKAEGNDLEAIRGHVSDSGEGRWTLADSLDLETPMPVLSAAIAARFYSRGEGDFTARVLAALRNQFGGHAVERSS